MEFICGSQDDIYIIYHNIFPNNLLFVNHLVCIINEKWFFMSFSSSLENNYLQFFHHV